MEGLEYKLTHTHTALKNAFNLKIDLIRRLRKDCDSYLGGRPAHFLLSLIIFLAP